MDSLNDKLFQVSVKGLFFDAEKRLLMLKEENGVWDLPGGRVQKGEDLRESLQRECREETGLVCEIIGEQPVIVYSAIDQVGRPRIMIFYRIELKSLDFTPSDECVEIQFFNKNAIRDLPSVPQLQDLVTYL